jgi:hydrogenase expression/formation protein HypE
MTLPLGKVPAKILSQIIFKNLGAKRSEVILGPTAGVDCAVLNLGNKSFITKINPITGALTRIGWLAVNVNANDVSTFGVEPAFFLSCILLPENANKKTLEIISTQIGKAAAELGMAVIGGHSETTPGLKNPIVVGCAIGMAEKNDYVTAAGAKAGDLVIMTKTAGIEGTAILASDRQRKLSKTIGTTVIREAQNYFKQTSITKEALAAYRSGNVHAMHNPTEGGIVGGMHEIADASNLGFRIYEDRIPVTNQTSQICKIFGINPLYLIASGSLLIAAKSENAMNIVQNMEKKDILATVIGDFLPSPNKRVILSREGAEKKLERPICDHLWVALEKS